MTRYVTMSGSGKLILIDAEHERRIAYSRLLEAFGYELLALPDTSGLPEGSLSEDSSALVVRPSEGATERDEIIALARRHGIPVLAIVPHSAPNLVANTPGGKRDGSEHGNHKNGLSDYDATVAEPVSRREIGNVLGRLIMKKNTGKKTEVAGKPIVLVVENNLDLMAVIRPYFESSGLLVLPTMDCAGAWRFAERVRPDALVTESDLPDGKGSELIAQFRSRFPGLVGIVLSSAADNKKAKPIRAHGMEFHFTKPLNLADMVTLLRRRLQSAAAA